MSSQYTTSLKIQEIGNGEQSGIWGSTTNTNWTLIEQAVAGVQTITMANTNYTLSNLNGLLDEARNMVLIVTGTNNTTYQVIAPLVSKMYVVTNNTTGGNAITIGASSGSVVTIPNGTTAQVYCDGSTGIFSAQTGSAGNFTVNGNFTVTGNQTDTGNLTVGGTFTANNAATFAVSPTAPTPTAGDNTTKVATTAFVQNALPSFGTMATQNANSVAITGGTIDGVTGTNSGMTVGTATNATNVTGTVAVGNGGTGLTSVGTSGYALASNGSGLTYKKLGLGITGETWTVVTGSRSFGSTSYTNSYSYPIMVTVTASSSGAGGNHELNAYVNGTQIASTVEYAAGNATVNLTWVVPPGATYGADTTGSNTTTNLGTWSELY